MTTIFTIGHGNRGIEEFVARLEAVQIEHLVDVRAYPASRRHPQFAREALERTLAAAGIRYLWEGEALGGRRRSAADSPHTALKSKGFRAYADHMVRDPFQRALDRLVALGSEERAAIMCAERLPWRCHRYLISDSLAARDVPVVHIVAPDRMQTHVLSRLARRAGAVLIYDIGQQPNLGL